MEVSFANMDISLLLNIHSKIFCLRSVSGHKSTAWAAWEEMGRRIVDYEIRED